MKLYYSHPQQTLQDVPGEISLALVVSGCPLRCKGCHSTETYPCDYGTELTIVELNRLLKKYKHTSCVLFYGGEWNIEALSPLVDYIKSLNLKVCLYSGRTLKYFTEDFILSLDYLKIGAYIENLGALRNPHTNQKFYEITDHTLIEKTELFSHSF
jgi:anaerobic ribonucleoside-triphosphate reductase activating protein